MITDETDGSVVVCAKILFMTGSLECNVSVELCTADGSATGWYKKSSLKQLYVIDFPFR